MAKKDEYAHLVVVGSSAGGIEALSTFVATLPGDFPAPVVLAQHLDPGRPSQLVQILERHSPLPIRAVTEHSALEPGMILVVPSNRQVSISDHEISLTGDGAERPAPSIDHLFSSAAATYGENLIAVILTGTGSDGSAGARRVKEAGGTVIIENPETAKYPSMPQSLSPTLVDFVEDLQRIGPLLNRLLTEEIPIDTNELQEGTQLKRFLEHLRQRSNIDFSRYRSPTIYRRLQRRMIATKTQSLDQYHEYLNRNPDEYQALVSSFLIKVTEFFRDGELFETLRNEVLPEIIEYARQNDYQLRFWSAGCATGEEAYSLAILLAELLGDELERFHIRIFATDLDMDAIMFARRGIYPEAALAQTPPELVARYFNEYGKEYEVNKLVRSMVIFGQHDLGRRSPFPRIDMILCRNVLIYFTEELQRRSLQLFAFSLRHDGFVALGKSESAGTASRAFALEYPDAKIYRRQGEAVMMPMEYGERLDSSPSQPFSQPHIGHPVWGSSSSPEVVRSQRETRRAQVTVEKTENLLFNLPHGVVVIDEHYDIITINNAARQLLGIHGVAIGEDLMHLTRSVPLGELRDVIDRCLRKQERVDAEIALPVQATGDWECSVHVMGYLQVVPTEESSTTAVVLVITDTSEVARERRRLRESAGREQTEKQRLAERVEHLTRINRELQSSNSELASANEQLRSYNQQLLVAHEEAQVSAEEIETLNEELQATNEELETLNEELQATVEELNATNEDMQARTAELQMTTVSLEEQRRTSEAERARLEAVLGSMGDAVLVVSGDCELVQMNPERFDELIGEDLTQLPMETDGGDAIEPEMTPQARAARGDTFTMQFTSEMPERGRRWFEAHSQPIRGDGESAGSVLVIRDVTDSSLRRLQEEFMSVASHELRTPLTALRGYLEMLRYYTDSESERTKRYVSVSLGMVHRLIRIVNDLLDIGRLQSGKFELVVEPVDVVDLIEEVVELGQSMSSGYTVDFESPGQTEMALLDPMRIQQVLLNLISNAMDHSPDADRILVRLQMERETIEIQVTDFGVGLLEEEIPLLFNQFYQGTGAGNTAPRGLGLGLYISSEIAEAHGGTISVDSTPGEGSTFTVSLPRVEADTDSEPM